MERRYRHFLVSRASNLIIRGVSLARSKPSKNRCSSPTGRWLNPLVLHNFSDIKLYKVNVRFIIFYQKSEMRRFHLMVKNYENGTEK